MKSQKRQNSGIFKNYKPKIIKKKCKDCKTEFEQSKGARYEKKYCEKCSEKRKKDYDDLWKVKAEDCEDAE